MRILRLGCRGADVADLQRRLGLMADGIFGPLTREAVREFQAANGLKTDGMAGPLTMAALGAGHAAGRPVDMIIIHCSDTPDGRDHTVEDIRAWHLARGFSDIGYHYVIYRDGTVRAGRPERVAGAHTSGYNTRSVGVCYIGGRTADGKTYADTRTQAQRQAMASLVAELRKKYPGATVHGHKEFAAKACPCFDVCEDPELCA